MKYPIILLHGMGYNDEHKLSYWGRIPQIYKERGYTIHYGHQDSSATTAANAKQIARHLDELFAEESIDKVNIIAHSKGGLEARYLVSQLGYADKVASITTLSTPHHGSKTVDKLLDFFPKWLVRFVCIFFDLVFKILKDEKPETYNAILTFRTDNSERFNDENPDVAGIFYQSYAFVMKNIRSDMLMWLPSLVVKLMDGENDGLLTPESVKWGEFKGIIRSNSNRGISHGDEIDFRRKPFCNQNGDGISDIIEIYSKIADDLEEMGF